MSDTLLTVQNLKKEFTVRATRRPSGATVVRAVDAVDLTLRANETLALIGESGSGKSTLARCLVRLLRPSAGDVFFREQNVLAMPRRELRRYRRAVQYIFPDADMALDPLQPVGEAIAEPLIAHGLMTRVQARQQAMESMEEVGLRAEHFARLPRQLSSGQCHRVVIARALTLHPAVIIADEPFASLDVITKSRLLELIQQLRARRKVAILLISHDLALARRLADRVAVMHRGKIVEENSVAALFAAPRHPYTLKLMEAFCSSPTAMQ